MPFRNLIRCDLFIKGFFPFAANLKKGPLIIDYIIAPPRRFLQLKAVACCLDDVSSAEMQ